MSYNDANGEEGRTFSSAVTRKILIKKCFVIFYRSPFQFPFSPDNGRFNKRRLTTEEYARVE